MRPSISLSLLLFSACAHYDLGAPPDHIIETTSGLSFSVDPNLEDRWELLWKGQIGEELRFTTVRFEQRQLGQPDVFHAVDPERVRYSNGRSSCSRVIVDEENEPAAEKIIVGSGRLASIDVQNVEPGDYRVSVHTVNAQPLRAEFHIAGLERESVIRLDQRAREVKTGACSEQPWRVDGLGHSVMRSLVAEELASTFEDRSRWPASIHSPESEAFLQELAERNGTVEAFGAIVIQSDSVQELWSYARGPHQTFFVQWVGDRLRPEREPTVFEYKVLKQGAWSPAVMDYLARRIDLLRETLATIPASRTKLRDLSLLIRKAPNNFEHFYPEHSEWMDREFSTQIGLSCHASYKIGCGFARHIPECEEALDKIRADFSLGQADVPTLQESTSREILLGI